MTITPIDILQRAKSLISDPRHWIGGDLTNKRASHNSAYEASITSRFQPDGSYAPASLRAADCFCAGLALNRAAEDLGREVRFGPTHHLAQRALNEATHGNAITGIAWIGDWNDKRARTHKEVMAAFDAAILKLKPSRV